MSGSLGTRGTRLVVAGILVREGRLLMSRRPPAGAWPGLWELPVPYDFATEGNLVPGGVRGHMTLLFFRVRGLIGTLRAKGADAVRWCPADEARILPTPPADGLFLVCRNHGALFNPEDGLCVAGPCRGESLVPHRVARSGAGWALDAGETR